MTGTTGIRHATLDWSAGAPRSVDFDDIYFSGDGPAEAAHVFLGGNRLPARFEGAARFTIGELGFGTGLNFLVAWNAWRRAPRPQSASLNFFSVEAFPLAPDDLARAHAQWPPLKDLSAAMRARLLPHPGFHRIDFEGGVCLTLFIGDVGDGLAQAELCADAWLLDGFAPDKNPDMWRPEIMKALAARSGAGATFATFTVAGAVRRVLEDAGFEIEKRPGYGAKREMLAGRLVRKPEPAARRKPWFDARKTPTAPGASVAIIGAGIAGASLADALRRAGFAPTVFEAKAPASGASGNAAGLIMPRLDAGGGPAARFHVAAYLYAVQLLRALGADAPVFNPCGVALHATSDAERERQKKLLAFGALPQGWMEKDANGLLFPQGGVVDPPAFVRALLGDAPLRRARVASLSQAGAQWRVETSNGESEGFDAVVIANGLDALRFAQMRSLPLAGSAGQIDWFPDAPAPARAQAFGPYAAPSPKGGLVIGATYAPVLIGAMAAFTSEATRTNIAAVARVLPEIAAALAPAQSTPRASVRCTTPDRLPVAGPVPDWGYYGGAYDGLRDGRKRDYPPGETLPGLFILTGLGSRGLVTAPLCAAMIAAALAGAPAPVDFAVAEALHPARFFIRELRRNRTMRL